MSDKKYSSPISCLHCGNKAPMQIAAEHSQVRFHENENSHFGWDEGPFWEILECPACESIMLRKGYYHEFFLEESAAESEMLYPNGSEQIRGLPDAISKAYAAAQKVKAIDSNAFAVLLGRVLDLVCIDKQAVGDTLYERLKDIANKGIMPQQLADMANALRHLRNIGAHADLGELTSSEVPILESLSKAILEYVYSAPALVKLVQSKIDKLKSKK